MVKIYTYVKRHNGSLYHRYIEDGERKKEQVSVFDYELFLKSNKESDSVSLFNDPLKRKTFSNIKEMSIWSNEMYKQSIPVYGMTRPEIQFISETYIDKLVPKDIRILNFDIETKIPEDGTFCEPFEATQPIVSIAMKLIGSGKFTVFGYKEYINDSDDVVFIKCDSEEDMLHKFIKAFEYISPDVLTGFNSNSYDVVFLVTRIIKLLGKSFANKLSPLNYWLNDPVKQFTDRESGEILYEIPGIIQLDYLQIYKKFALAKLDSYRLDRVAEFELEENKLDYSEYKNLNDLYERNYQTFIDYNIHDVRLVERLDKKLNFLNSIFSTAYDSRINFDDCFNQTRGWDSKIYNELKKRGKQVPPKTKHPQVEIPGGFVKNPKIGLHRWCVSFDLNSLYPNIMRMLNLSPETLYSEMTFEQVEDFINLNINTKELVDIKLAKAANGALFTHEKYGLIPELLQVASDERVRIKNLMLELRKEIEQLKAEKADPILIREKEDLMTEYDSDQNNKKITLNSCYGYFTCPHSRFFSPSLASAITLTGQSIIRFIDKRINIFLNEKLKTDSDYVILSDTDSIVINLEPLIIKLFGEDFESKYSIEKIRDFIIKFSSEVITPFLDQSFGEFQEAINAHDKKRLVMKLENIADRTFIRAKKNYVMSVRYSEGTSYSKPKMKMMGIETKKSSTPDFVKDILEEGIKIILYKTESDFHQFIKEQKINYFRTDYAKLAVPSGVNDIEKFLIENGDSVSWISGTPSHVKASICYNHLIKKYKIENVYPRIVSGSKCRVIYLKTPNVLQNDAIAFVDTLPPEFELTSFVDYQKMWQKSVLKPLESFTSKIGWSLERKPSLANFF